MSAAAAPLVPKIAERLRQEGAEEIVLVVGGTIPNGAVPA